MNGTKRPGRDSVIPFAIVPVVLPAARRAPATATGTVFVSSTTTPGDAHRDA